MKSKEFIDHTQMYRLMLLMPRKNVRMYQAKLTSIWQKFVIKGNKPKR